MTDRARSDLVDDILSNVGAIGDFAGMIYLILDDLELNLRSNNMLHTIVKEIERRVEVVESLTGEIPDGPMRIRPQDDAEQEAAA